MNTSLEILRGKYFSLSILVAKDELQSFLFEQRHRFFLTLFKQVFRELKKKRGIIALNGQPSRKQNTCR